MPTITNDTITEKTDKTDKTGKTGKGRTRSRKAPSAANAASGTADTPETAGLTVTAGKPSTTAGASASAGKDATSGAKSSRQTVAAEKATSARRPRTRKKAVSEVPEFTVVGPVSTAPAIVFESGTLPTRIGNAFDLVLTEDGDLKLRYQDRGRWFGPQMQAVVVADPGPAQAVLLVDLVRHETVHEGRTRVPPTTRAVALAFTCNGAWDSNESRNYLVSLKA